MVFLYFVILNNGIKPRPFTSRLSSFGWTPLILRALLGYFIEYFMRSQRCQKQMFGKGSVFITLYHL